jgi:hypothetical protein
MTSDSVGIHIPEGPGEIAVPIGTIGPGDAAHWTWRIDALVSGAGELYARVCPGGNCPEERIRIELSSDYQWRRIAGDVVEDEEDAGAPVVSDAGGTPSPPHAPRGVVLYLGVERGNALDVADLRLVVAPFDDPGCE